MRASVQTFGGGGDGHVDPVGVRRMKLLLRILGSAPAIGAVGVLLPARGAAACGVRGDGLPDGGARHRPGAAHPVRHVVGIDGNRVRRSRRTRCTTDRAGASVQADRVHLRLFARLWTPWRTPARPPKRVGRITTTSPSTDCLSRSRRPQKGSCAATDDSGSRATLKYPVASWTWIVHARRGRRIALDRCWPRPAIRPTTRLRQHSGDQECHHLHRRRRRNPAVPRLPDRAAGREVRLHRGQLPVDLRRAADRRAAGVVHHPDPAPHAAARGPQAVLRRLPAQRPPDAGAVQRGQRLSAYYPDSVDPLDNKQVELSTIRLLAKLPTIAGLRLQEVGGPAVPVPRQTR